MKKKTLILLYAVCCLLPVAQGQLVSLSRSGGGPLWVDLDRLYNYNQYEKSRWGLGLRYGYHLNELKAGDPWYERLSVGAYFGYGYADQRFKWGADAYYWTDLKHQGKVYLSFFHDLTPEASRQLSAYSLSSFTATGSFMNRLFSDTRRLTAGFSSRTRGHERFGLEVRLSDERKLYGGNTIYYPQNQDEWNTLGHTRFAEALLLFEHDCGIMGEVTFGHHTGEWWQDSGFFVRALVQYDQVFPIGNPFDLQVYAQAGFSDHAPLSRCFNLGGTWGSPLLFHRSLLTARLDEFIANVFALTCLRFGFSQPLFVLQNNLLVIGTAPRPFVLLDAAWGKMRNFNNAAPDRGIAEVGAGIDGLVRWGAVDWGIVVAYRLTPPETFYHLPEPKDNFLFLFTATLRR